MDAITTALQTAFSSVQTTVLGYIPVALASGLAIMGAIVGVKAGIRFFRSIAKG